MNTYSYKQLTVTTRGLADVLNNQAELGWEFIQIIDHYRGESGLSDHVEVLLRGAA